MKRFLLWFARTKVGSFLIGFLFVHFSFSLPMKRLKETKTLVAFFHPQPNHKVHILIVPKLKYRSILDIPPGETTFTNDLVETLKSLIKQFDLEQGAYRLIMNGGDNQEVDHLHFHLISDDDL
jgi:histidine triad (HIT) family protein